MDLRALAPVRLAIAAAALCLQGCSTGGAPRGTLINGAAPLPGMLADNPSPAPDGGPLTLSKVIKTFVEIAKEDLWPCLGAEQQAALANVRLEFVTKNTAAFLMYSSIYDLGGGQLDRRIYISEATWRNFANIAMARRLQDENVGIDLEWVTRYMLYMRNTTDFDRVIPPSAAAGLNVPGALSEAQRSKVLADVVTDAHRRATFLLAHEFYHHLYPLRKAPGESETDYLRRQAPDEQKADNFAMDKMLCRVVITRHLGDLGAAPMLFLDWMLLMEGSRHKLAAGTHPLDHVRARNAARYAIEKISRLESKPEWLEMIKLFEDFVTTTNEIDKEGPVQYFKGIDEEARGITLASLKLRR